MYDIVIGRVVEHLMQPAKSLRKDLSSLFIERGLHMLETRIMGFWENPCLKWKSGGEWGDREEGLIFNDKTVFLLKLLSDDITEDTAVFIMKITFGPLDLFVHPCWDDGEGNDLRVGMFQRGAGSHPMVLEDENISKPLVTSQISHPLTVGPKDIVDSL